MQKDAAETIAANALNFLARDAERLVRFLDLSGLNPGSIREAARDAGFLAGVLEYICGDQALLLEFADHSGVTPSAVEKARLALSGRWDRDLP
jgi:Protein of unknown function (DUF3572)